MAFTRGMSLPPSQRSPMTVGSSRFSGVGGVGTVGSSSTSYLNSNLPNHGNTLPASTSSHLRERFPHQFPTSSSLTSANVRTTAPSSSAYGMGEPSYSSVPQFDGHGHSIHRATPSASSTSSSLLSSTNYDHHAGRPGSRAEQLQRQMQAQADATRRLLAAADESSYNAARYNNAVPSLLLPSGSNGSRLAAVDRNPLQFMGSESYDSNNNNNNPRGSTYNLASPSSTSSSTSNSLLYREPLGAHLYHHSQQQQHQGGSRNLTSASSSSSSSSTQRNASAGVSSRRTTVHDYANNFGTTSAAYGASVVNHTHHMTGSGLSSNDTTSPIYKNNSNTATTANRNSNVYGGVPADDSDDDDGPHISLAARGMPGTRNAAALNHNQKNLSDNSSRLLLLSSTTASNNNPLAPGSSSSSPSPASYQSPLTPAVGGPVRTPVGLRNIGNTCYMNASLQCIIQASGTFISALPSAAAEGASGKSKLSKALAALAKSSNITDLTTVKGGAAHLNHEFHGGRQNDAHEFIREFLHALHIEHNRVGKAPYREMKDIEGESDADAARRWFAYFRSHDDSIVTDYFGGFMRATTVCGSCSHRSLSFSPVWDLSLSMSSTGSSGSNVVAMMNDFMRVETLGSDGAFTCEKCKKKRQGKRQSMLVNWPKVLVLHLCRFTYSGARNSQQVDFPARLDEGDIPFPRAASGVGADGSPVNGYSLSGVVLHRGTASFGHYTALVRPHGSRTWYNCDDSLVNPITESEVLRHRTEAYVLFYTMDG